MECVSLPIAVSLKFLILYEIHLNSSICIIKDTLEPSPILDKLHKKIDMSHLDKCKGANKLNVLCFLGVVPEPEPERALQQQVAVAVEVALVWESMSRKQSYYRT